MELNGFDLSAVAAATERAGRAARVVVARVEGSAPREPGAAMIVTADAIEGTIGGGALEQEAVAEARRLLAERGAWPRAVRTWPLGPRLGQCCGGSATLAFEAFGADEVAVLTELARDRRGLARPMKSGAPPAADGAPTPVRAMLKTLRSGGEAGLVHAGGWLAEPFRPALTPLALYGAGHVGRAVVRVFEGLPYRILWIDDRRARFPDAIPSHAEMLVAANPADAVAAVPAGAVHVVMTYSHALDLEICHRVLARGDFAHLGLIGSLTKRARFLSRLRGLGHSGAALARLSCPIGLPGVGGKAPAAVAVSLAAELLSLRAAEPARREAAS